MLVQNPLEILFFAPAKKKDFWTDKKIILEQKTGYLSSGLINTISPNIFQYIHFICPNEFIREKINGDPMDSYRLPINQFLVSKIHQLALI